MTQQGKTRLDERLIAALLSKPTVSAAARAAGVSPRTAQRRMRDAEFEEKFRDAKVRLVSETTSRLTANAVGQAKRCGGRGNGAQEDFRQQKGDARRACCSGHRNASLDAGVL